MAVLKSVVALLSLLSLASAASRRPNLNIPPAPAIPKVSIPADTPPPTKNGVTLPPYDQLYTFDQLIDHSNPSLGTFKQRYYFTEEFFVDGGPVVITTPGEGPVDGYQGYLTNRTINGRVTQANGGAAVVIEHRFFGQSNPYSDLSTEHLKVHTLENAIEDLVYFTQNAKLPFITGNYSTTPDKVPWVLIGGSYSGALTSWTMVHRPGIFWAGYSSSGVVEAISYLWAYFEPIREHMPRNCSADVQRVISHMDQTFLHGKEADKVALKTKFGMANVTHYDDVAGALRNPLWEWQSLSPSSGPNGKFYQFCDALEVKDGVSAGPDGWGLDHALDAFGNYMVGYIADYCGDQDRDACLGTYDTSLAYWHDTAVGNVWRSWVWMCCNWFGYWQDGAPKLWPTLVTRLVGPTYDNRQCTYFFPEKFAKITPPDNNYINTKYQGWNAKVDRIFYATGERDPWRDATMSSIFHHRASTQNTVIAKSDGGFHCSDLSVKNAVVDSSVKAVQDLGVQYLTKWLNDWKVVKNQPHFAAPLPALPAPAVPATTIPDDVANAQPDVVDTSGLVDNNLPATHGSGTPRLIPNAWAKQPIEL